WRHGGLTTAAHFARDGHTLLTMGVDGLRIWDLATGKPLHRLATQDGRNLNRGVLSADGKQVLSIESNLQCSCLRLWDVATGQLMREFGKHPCAAACFSPDGTMLATMGTS